MGWSHSSCGLHIRNSVFLGTVIGIDEVQTKFKDWEWHMSRVFQGCTTSECVYRGVTESAPCQNHHVIRKLASREMAMLKAVLWRNISHEILWLQS